MTALHKSVNTTSPLNFHEACVRNRAPLTLNRFGIDGHAGRPGHQGSQHESEPTFIEHYALDNLHHKTMYAPVKKMSAAEYLQQRG